MRRLIFILLFLFSSIGFISCGDGTPADPDEEIPGERTPDDKSPSIDEEEPSDSNADADDGITDDGEDVDVETPDVDEGNDEEEEGEVAVSPRIASFASSKNCVVPGSKVTLNWETENAEAVYLNSTPVEASGSKTVWAFSEMTHTLTAVRGAQTKSRTVSIYLKERSVVTETTEESFDAGTIRQLQSSADGTLLVLSGGKVYKGSFGGDFTRLTPNTSVSSWTAVEIDPIDSDILYAGTTGRIYRSENGGSSWPDVIPVRRNNIDLSLNTLYVSPEKTDLVYIGFEGGGFVLDADRNTLELKSDLNTESIRHFAADEERVTAATRSGIFLSTDDGDNWSEKNAADWGEIHALNIFEGVLYVSTEEGLYHAETSTLSNPVWEKSAGIEGPVYQVLMREETGFFVFDRGFSWGTLLPQSVLYAAAEEGLYRQSGKTWDKLTDEETYWILEDNGVIAVSEESMTHVKRTAVYSDNCPNKPKPANPNGVSGRNQTGLRK